MATHQYSFRARTLVRPLNSDYRLIHYQKTLPRPDLAQLVHELMDLYHPKLRLAHLHTFPEDMHPMLLRKVEDDPV